jgi:hypothetical protein
MVEAAGEVSWMNRWMKPCAVLIATVLMIACVNQREQTKREIQRFMQTATGEFLNASGNTLVMVPVYSRMIGLDTLYVERIASGGGTSERLVSIEESPDGKRILQLSFVFTQQGQWRNMRDNPELFSALLPKDVRPAGTCDIKLAADLNSLTYSCGGSVPESFTRAQHGTAR